MEIEFLKLSPLVFKKIFTKQIINEYILYVSFILHSSKVHEQIFKSGYSALNTADKIYHLMIQGSGFEDLTWKY